MRLQILHDFDSSSLLFFYSSSRIPSITIRYIQKVQQILNTASIYTLCALLQIHKNRCKRPFIYLVIYRQLHCNELLMLLLLKAYISKYTNIIYVCMYIRRRIFTILKDANLMIMDPLRSSFNAMVLFCRWMPNSDFHSLSAII